MTARKLPPKRLIKWKRTFRIIPSRYPPVDLFERIADPADWETLAAIEGLTNDRLRDQIGDISIVPPGERISGPGASTIMAAFTHIGIASRFTDGTTGVYYANNRFDGSLREVVYHQERFLRRTHEPETRLEMRTYVGSLAESLHDIRGGWPDAHDPDSYLAAQKLGAALRAKGSNGVVYNSVRFSGSWNVAAFRPKVLASKSGRAHVIQGPHVFLRWNGSRIDRTFKLPDAGWRPLPTLTNS